MRSRAGQFHRHPPAELRHVSFEHGRPDSIEHELPVTTRLDQPRACQLLQVMRDRRLSNRKAAAEPLAPDLALPRDVLEDLEPSRVGERLCDSLELLGFQGSLRS